MIKIESYYIDCDLHRDDFGEEFTDTNEAQTVEEAARLVARCADSLTPSGHDVWLDGFSISIDGGKAWSAVDLLEFAGEDDWDWQNVYSVSADDMAKFVEWYKQANA